MSVRGWPRSQLAVVTVFALGILVRCLLMLAYRPAFLGIPDTGAYVDAAHHDLFLDPVHPSGYAWFLRVLHFVSADLSVTIVVQHALGVATAYVLFTSIARVTGHRIVGLLTAAVVLFNGLELWSEHTPLSDPLFTFLIASSLALTVQSRDRGRWCLVAIGALVASATLVRTVGLLLIPLVGVWLLVTTPGAVRRRIGTAAAPVSIAAVLLAGYVAVQDHRSGVFGFTPADGRITYAIAAPFADCSRFTPPPGTRGLCETTRSDDRGSVNQYLFGFPDHGSGLPPGGRPAVSPAWRLFGPIPGGNDRLGAFGRAAIIHQPLDYLRQVVRNFSSFWRASPQTFLADAARPDPGSAAVVAAYYSGGPAKGETGFGILKTYARAVEVDGVLIVLLLIASIVSVAVSDPSVRPVAALYGAAGWVLLLGASAVANDPRYALPALGPLAASVSIGLLPRHRGGWRSRGTGASAGDDD
jgi:hypothetical protein